ncbi:nicotinate phosphoribosyltransferase [Sporothrix brasiliensis 5110]|uniref:nicotinate phosphoribosyltransferase n=1 Tax=Sporothrix brasiliensis 5110 TaxID=1398154 RepID=A0A0C2FB07_9PEZI|nr:nicotinate phosphoribosyltransferase [Sporothrix brasiliensis 5110]KIH88248.1 nicotinate phosphoribosyltransferase [Sporothrix brasiliensis 5110]
MDFNSSSPYPEGVISFLDTDLYKLTMQCAVLKYYKDVPVTYSFTNRTPEKKLSRTAYQWLSDQVRKLGNISLSDEELAFLKLHCPYLTPAYLDFLKEFRLNPREEVTIAFVPVSPSSSGTESPDDLGDVDIAIRGAWVDTILYEIPILALTSEAYFKFMDTDWNYDGQQELAFDKGMRLLEAGCVLSEFGTRRRRDYHTQALVFRGLVQASREAAERGLPGKLSGTSNVHLAMRFNIPPVGTVAHEWFMGIAALSGEYRQATEEALCRWVGCFGEGVLGIALTDTFGTPEFLREFGKPVRRLEGDAQGPAAQTTTAARPVLASAADSFTSAASDAPSQPATGQQTDKTYARIFTGVRQDSGDPTAYVKLMREFYDAQGITDKKVIVFSDSLNLERCLEYKKVSEAAGFQPTFGVGTYLTNDFVNLTTGLKSVPLNIVIKLSSANGHPAVKISDNAGKNTGDKATVDRVKRELGYVEKDWEGGDETRRWGKEGDRPDQPIKA